VIITGFPLCRPKDRKVSPTGLDSARQLDTLGVNIPACAATQSQGPRFQKGPT